jgi:hypothetical protein
MQSEEYKSEDVYLEPTVEVSSDALSAEGSGGDEVVIQICTHGC